MCGETGCPELRYTRDFDQIMKGLSSLAYKGILIDEQIRNAFLKVRTVADDNEIAVLDRTMGEVLTS